MTVDRTSPTTMVVSWRPLTLAEARGFISHYTVRYSPQIISGGRKRQAAMMVEVEGMDSNSTTITDLDPNTVYEVQLSASTGAGDGNFSEPIQATLFLEGTSPQLLILYIVISDLVGGSSSDAVVGVVIGIIVAVVTVTVLILVLLIIVKYVRKQEIITRPISLNANGRS